MFERQKCWSHGNNDPIIQTIKKWDKDLNSSATKEKLELIIGKA